MKSRSAARPTVGSAIIILSNGGWCANAEGQIRPVSPCRWRAGFPRACARRAIALSRAIARARERSAEHNITKLWGSFGILGREEDCFCRTGGRELNRIEGDGARLIGELPPDGRDAYERYGRRRGGSSTPRPPIEMAWRYRAPILSHGAGYKFAPVGSNGSRPDESAAALYQS
jgi:hypothetical protein